MPWHDLALILAGLIGAAVAVVHGTLIQRLLVVPLLRPALPGQVPSFSPAVRRLIAPLFHFSTVIWFAGGIALLLATSLQAQARLSVGTLVGGAYLLGAAGNFWATRGRHPGWMLMILALGLIVYGVMAPSLET